MIGGYTIAVLGSVPTYVNEITIPDSVVEIRERAFPELLMIPYNDIALPRLSVTVVPSKLSRKMIDTV